MNTDEIAFAAVATNGDEENKAVPQDLCEEFLAQLGSEERAAILGRPCKPEDIQDNIRDLAAKWHMRCLCIAEAQKHGYEVAPGGFIGLNWIVAIDDAEGLEAGLELAKKYNFKEGYRSIADYSSAPTSYLFIHESRQISNAIMFIGSNERVKGDVYSVGMVYATVELMAKYGQGRELPGY